MKDRILNGLMLAMVALALGLSFFRDEKETAPPFSPALQESAATAAAEEIHPIIQYCSRRERQRQEELSALRVILEKEDADAALRKMAGEQIVEITKNAETELAMEAALAARGKEGICIFRKGKMTVFTKETLDETEAALIFHLAMEIAGIEMENIRLAAC